MGKNNSGPRIAPDRVSSAPTTFPGPMGTIFIFEFATIDPIDKKCEHFEVSGEKSFVRGRVESSLVAHATRQTRGCAPLGSKTTTFANTQKYF